MYIYNNVSNNVNVVRFSEESIQIYSHKSADGEFQYCVSA